MSSYLPLQPVSSAPHLFPTAFYLADLDFWVAAARDTVEYQSRLDLADQIVQCYRTRSTGFLIEGGNLTSLPRALGCLHHLEELTISKNSFLISLPAEIGQLKSLKRLVLSDLGLTALPPEIGCCSSLEDLHVGNTKLTLIPNEIGNLLRLEYFYLGGNSQLFYLSPSIGHLQRLREISLQNCNFSYLPKELFSLPRLTYLNLEGCPFSSHALERLQAFRRSFCTIFYSQENLRDPAMIERPLDELIKKLYHLSGQRSAPFFQNLSKHPDLEILRQFLNKFFHAENFWQDDPTHAAKAAKLIKYLSEAEINRYYRNSFFACLRSASSLEKDQISIVFFLLGTEMSLSHADLNNLQTLYKLLLSVWTTRFILRTIREKLNDLAVYDSFQIYLGYLSKLGNWHDLPLAEADLCLFDIAEIPAVQLHTASQQIQRVEANLTKQAEFLASHDLWLKALNRANPTTYADKRENPKALAEWTRTLIAGFIPDFR